MQTVLQTHAQRSGLRNVPEQLVNKSLVMSKEEHVIIIYLLFLAKFSLSRYSWHYSLVYTKYNILPKSLLCLTFTVKAGLKGNMSCDNYKTLCKRNCMLPHQLLTQSLHRKVFQKNWPHLSLECTQ